MDSQSLHQIYSCQTYIDSITPDFNIFREQKQKSLGLFRELAQLHMKTFNNIYLNLTKGATYKKGILEAIGSCSQCLSPKALEDVYSAGCDKFTSSQSNLVCECCHFLN